MEQSKRHLLKRLFLELAAFAKFGDDAVKEYAHSSICEVIDDMDDQHLTSMIRLVEGIIKTLESKEEDSHAAETTDPA